MSNLRYLFMFNQSIFSQSLMFDRTLHVCESSRRPSPDYSTLEDDDRWCGLSEAGLECQ